MRLPLKSLWSEFKTFAFKGNMIDLAVAVVIGAAFSGVINSLVKDIIMPSVSYVTTAATTAKQVAEDAVDRRISHPSTTQASDATTIATPPNAAAPPPPAPPAAPKPAAPNNTQPVDFSWTIGRIQIGHFIAELLNFLIVSFAVFVIMVKLLGSVVKKVGNTPGPSEPTTKECPECLSVIPIKATRCAFCTAKLPPVP